MESKQDDTLVSESPTRACLVCSEQRRIVGKVGPLEIKENCPNKCGIGYVRQVRKPTK